MQKKIIPSIIAKNQKEFNGRFEKIKSSSIIHLDVMDGKFVSKQSLNFNLIIPRKKYQIHLMVNNPERFIKLVHSKADTIIFHIESCENQEQVKDIIKFIKKKKKKAGIAINPKTPIKKIQPFLKSINIILIMTVNPGKYGAKFLPSALKKVNELRNLKKNIRIGIDGGINEQTIKKAKLADFFISGSYIQNLKNPKQAIRNLKKLANN